MNRRNQNLTLPHSRPSRAVKPARPSGALAATRNRLGALLIGVFLASPAAQAAPQEPALDLRYKAFDAEELLAVATADGDLQVFNSGPGRARVTWIDPQSGSERQRVLNDMEALFTNGALGAAVSAGTLISIEKVGGAAYTRGFASLPSAAPLAQALVGNSHNGTFLPWRRDYRLNLDGTHGPTVIDAVVMELVETLEMPVGGFLAQQEVNLGLSSLVETLEMPVGGFHFGVIEVLLGTASIAGGARSYDKFSIADAGEWFGLESAPTPAHLSSNGLIELIISAEWTQADQWNACLVIPSPGQLHRRYGASMPSLFYALGSHPAD